MCKRIILLFILFCAGTVTFAQKKAIKKSTVKKEAPIPELLKVSSYINTNSNMEGYKPVPYLACADYGNRLVRWLLNLYKMLSDLQEKLNQNKNGQIEQGKATHIFWIDLKNPANNGIQYKN